MWKRSLFNAFRKDFFSVLLQVPFIKFSFIIHQSHPLYVSSVTLQEYQSFTDLKFSKNKAIKKIQWHPTVRGLFRIFLFYLELNLYSRRSPAIFRSIVSNVPFYGQLYNCNISRLTKDSVQLKFNISLTLGHISCQETVFSRSQKPSQCINE